MTSITEGKQAAIWHEEENEVSLKVGVSLAIFALSFLAVSFPAISKRARYLRIPSLVFFIGKHFGTGVILSTAFVHLLPDSFNALKSRWTGFIILMSLLSIFLVEYITTAYVDHLQSYASAPSSPSHSPSRASSRASSRTREHPDVVPIHEETPLLGPSQTSTVRTGFPVINEQDDTADGVSVIEVYPSPTKSRSRSDSSLILKAQGVAETDENIIFGGAHHRHESRNTHASHSLPPTTGKAGGVTVGKKVAVEVLYDDDSEERKKKLTKQQQNHHHYYHHHHHHSHTNNNQGHGHPHPHHSHGHAHLDLENFHNAEDSDHDDDCEVGEEVKIGRRRQIVGILILQIGIMLHSLVIGLTMSVSSGSEFTTLVTAILFHQLFEGLSLGIRIAALPSESKRGAFSHLPGYVLKPLLTLSFALTTPTGLWIGLAAFSSTSSSSLWLKQMQGVLSATSAGMLIYAACVEMLAGDFVMDPMMWRSGLRRQVLALVSLVLGVAAMSAIE
ncbi:Zinc/iron permease [Irpex rosettiformis]|uniref:Zinc/iron permease n=1 Tax=Irpex rosettiformis TaxID=378272 RepID=A0ACB8TR80_9APHY|nr:Zinc/iron permease [Irpex rosettiformis]